MTKVNSEKEDGNKRKNYENPSKKRSNSTVYDTWVFENYTKERLKALGVIS